MARFEQPRAPNAPPKAPTPLELSIFEFEKKCREYHAKKALEAPADETPAQASARQAKLQRDLQHLYLERNRIKCTVQIQAQLEQYRADCESKSPDELLKEKHHPTRHLARHMAAAGEPRPSRFHAAHHIIPGTGRWRQPEVEAARMELHIHGIGVNDPKNGVHLPVNIQYKDHWATPGAPAHTEIHGYNYETWIIRLFSLPIPKGVFEARLRDTKGVLKFGGYPIEITQPKNLSWNGS